MVNEGSTVLVAGASGLVGTAAVERFYAAVHELPGVNSLQVLIDRRILPAG